MDIEKTSTLETTKPKATGLIIGIIISAIVIVVAIILISLFTFVPGDHPFPATSSLPPCILPEFWPRSNQWYAIRLQESNLFVTGRVPPPLPSGLGVAPSIAEDQSQRWQFTLVPGQCITNNQAIVTITNGLNFQNLAASTGRTLSLTSEINSEAKAQQWDLLYLQQFDSWVINSVNAGLLTLTVVPGVVSTLRLEAGDWLNNPNQRFKLLIRSAPSDQPGAGDQCCTVEGLDAILEPELTF